MIPFPFASLRVRLLLLVLLTILPIFGLVVYTTREERQRETAAVQQDALHLTHLAASNQEHLIEQTRQLLLALAQLSQVRERDAAACSALVANFLQHYPLYANLGAVEPDGDLFCSALPPSG